MKSNRNGPLSQVKGADVFWAIGGLFTQTEEWPSREPAMRSGRAGERSDRSARVGFKQKWAY